MFDKPSPHPNALPNKFSGLKKAAISKRLRWVELLVILPGLLAVLIHVGLADISADRIPEMNWIVVGSLAMLTLSRMWRCWLSNDQMGVQRIFNAGLIAPIVWLAGIGVIQYGFARSQVPGTASFWPAGVVWNEAMLSVVAVLSALAWCRTLASQTDNSAVLLIGSFSVVIAVGTLLLKLPICRAAGPDGATQAAADWNVALFTATSASCVTGLIVEPTGSYWSPVGHAVIFGLFQVGGLGILTFGAFLAVFSGRQGLQFREARTLRDMLDADTVQDSRRLLLTILAFTLCVEAVGAISLMGLWPDLPWPQRVWYSVFHSVSAFCNAGFSLQDSGFQGMGSHWQVWGPLTLLIILGGLGFPVVRDLWTVIRRRLSRSASTPLFPDAGIRPRLSVHSRLVLWSAAALLSGGAVFWFVLESLNAGASESAVTRIADAWFQSATFRTAGFNTVDHATMNPATKLLAIVLMFIGAAPGSTGGGVKTVVFALTMLNIWAVFRGRDRVEIFGRCVPANQVARSLSMIAIGIMIVLITTGLLVIFEQRPERFLDHLYEATSAFATAGVSAGITPHLSLPSRLLICGVMFLGRVGPITLLIAMASPAESSRYEYPQERVSLG